MTRTVASILLLLILIGSVLRIAGLFDDFWLDEIWSYDISTRMHKPLDILLSPDAHLDNNHPLNTLYLWLMGFQRHWWLYRIPSLVFGIASLPLVPMIALRRGRPQAVLATALFAFSYPLTFFASEARGYAMLIFFSLLTVDAAERYLARPTWPSAAQFAVGFVLGLLSHLTFVFLAGGIFLWTIYRLSRAASPRVAVFNVFRLHVVPVIFFVFIYMVFGRHVEIGGGPPAKSLDSLATAISSLMAVRGPVALQWLAAALTLLLCIWLIVSLRRRGSDWWLLLAAAAFLTPALVFVRQAIVMDRPQPIAPRYFLVLLPLLILCASILLPDVLRRPWMRWPAITALAVFFAANLSQTFLWLQIGRGHYADAILYIAQHTPDDTITVISDHYRRTTTLLNFYGSRVLPPNRNLLIFDGTEPIPPQIGPPLWAVRSFPFQNTPPAQSYTDPRTKARYLLDREFTFHGLSGYSWYLYRRAAPQAASSLPSLSRT